MTIHFTSDNWYLAVFHGDITNSADLGRALSLGDDMSKRAGAKGNRGVHDARFCGRAPGREGCSYVGGNRPAWVEGES